MSEFIKIAPNGQWDLVKNDGTGVVAAPKPLNQVHDWHAAANPKPAMPKITPQPATKVGLANAANRTVVGAPSPLSGTHVNSQSGNIDPTVIRPQTGTQHYAMSPQGAPSPVNQPAPTRITNMPFSEQGLPMGYHPDPFNAAIQESQAHEQSKTVAPSIARKSEPNDTHDEKGRCNNCGSKSCDGGDCKVDHAKVAVEANAEKNRGFRNQIKVAGNGQWGLKKGLYGGDNLVDHPVHGPSEIEHKHMVDGKVFTTAKTLNGKVWHKSEHPNAKAAHTNHVELMSQVKKL